MNKIQTEILVIGGGATGTGVVRDLAMRGFKAVLVEKRDLTHGTSGRYHGLLHSGGRYVVKDPQAARECIVENRILRRIMPFAIEDTGGFFVLTPWDDPEYAGRFVAGCQAAGIPVEEVAIEQMLREEPLLNRQITRCFRVPDGSADSFIGADANAESARQYGARILPYHAVQGLIQENGRVVGARVHDLVKDEDLVIHAELVVNAAGAWAGQITGSVGVQVRVIPGKGTMIAANHRIVNTVINRCKMPSDGDILVPAHTVAVIGTTDVPVEDPDQFAIEPWEVKLLMEEGDKMIPGFKDMRMLRAWGGVRPLYQETQAGGNREMSRAFVLLDHAERDGLPGLVTITSGKWTTYRKMAEVTVDLVCKHLGVDRPCRTADEVLPEPLYAQQHGKARADESHGGSAHTVGAHHSLGTRLGLVEAGNAFGDLVCECELATYSDVKAAIIEGQARTIDDIRRDVRLGMGPCQGGFCTLRAAGILKRLRGTPIAEINAALRDFLQERWKGLLPVLWGQQLRQERLDELIYLSVLNTEHLPGPQATRLASTNYAIPEKPVEVEGPSRSAEGQKAQSRPAAPGAALDVLVIGAGIAGLTAAWQVASRGKKVRVLSKGWGSQYWTAGCIDVLGYDPRSGALVEAPGEGVARLIQQQTEHPYAKVGVAGIEEAVSAFQSLYAEWGYPMPGSLEQNWLLPTGVGGLRPTCLAPQSMIAGDMRRRDPALIVGFDQFLDFYPEMIAANLSAQGIPAQGICISLPLLQERNFITARTLAWMFDHSEHRQAVIRAVKAAWPKNGPQPHRVGFPAVLGLAVSGEAQHELEEGLGLPVFEIPSLPASIPGIRLTKVLMGAIETAGGRVFDGMQAIGARINGNRLEAVMTEASVRPKSNRAEQFVLATGGLLGGGIFAHREGQVREVICGLPVDAPTRREDWFQREFLAAGGHPIYSAGLRVDLDFHPVDEAGQVILSNVYAAGSTLAQADPIRERSLEGLALATGYVTGRRLSR